MRLLSHAEVWNTIADLTARCSRRKAAVAYVSSDVVIKFGNGDLLVTDASDAAVLAGQTSGRLIERAFMRGARIVSAERLHAKVFLFDSTLILGSANISIRSRSALLEAAIMADGRDLVGEADQFINRVADEGQVIDRHRIDVLLTLEANRPQSSAASQRLGEPHIIFFKEIRPGDLKKYQRASSEAHTGGGARDLRVSPENSFGPLLQQMISEPGPGAGVTHGEILSQRLGGGFHSTEVELWPPTGARDKELRFARIYDVPGWHVDEAVYERENRSGRILFYVLEMDIFGTIFAKVLNDTQLSAGYPLVAQHLARLIARRRRNRAIVGAVDVARQVTVP
jgi:hypothetical protein